MLFLQLLKKSVKQAFPSAGFFFSFPAFTYPWVFLCPSINLLSSSPSSERRQLLMGAGLAFSESSLRWLMPQFPGGKVEGTHLWWGGILPGQLLGGMVAMKQGKMTPEIVLRRPSPVEGGSRKQGKGAKQQKKWVCLSSFSLDPCAPA